FQAEDGIRDYKVTGVQTCALPISDVHGIPHLVWWNRDEQRLVEYGSSFAAMRAVGLARGLRDTVVNLNEHHLSKRAETIYEALRSEERRVGKECRSRWSPDP